MKTDQTLTMVTEVIPATTTVSSDEAEQMVEADTPELASDKKTDELITPEKPRNLVWRLGSGIYSTATGAVGGAVGYSVGGIKWVAGKGYDATTAVVSTTATVVKKVPVPTLRRKDKKE